MGNLLDWLNGAVNSINPYNSKAYKDYLETQRSRKEKRNRQAINKLYTSNKGKSNSKSSSGSKNKVSSKNKKKSSGSSGSGSSGSGSSGSGKTTSNKVIEDVTAKAVKSNTKTVTNKSNDYKEYWTKTGTEDHRITDDTPDFHIYISHQKYKAGTGTPKTDEY